jgi:hypothetical protein
LNHNVAVLYASFVGRTARRYICHHRATGAMDIHGFSQLRRELLDRYPEHSTLNFTVFDQAIRYPAAKVGRDRKPDSLVTT